MQYGTHGVRNSMGKMSQEQEVSMVNNHPVIIVPLRFSRD